MPFAQLYPTLQRARPHSGFDPALVDPRCQPQAVDVDKPARDHLRPSSTGP